MNKMDKSPIVTDITFLIKEKDSKLVNKSVSVSKKCSEITA